MSKNSLVRRKKKVISATSAITNIALEKLIAEVDNIAKKFLKTKKGKCAGVAGGAGGEKGYNYYDQIKKLFTDNKDKIKKLKENLIYEIFVTMTMTSDMKTTLISITKDIKDTNRDRAKKFLDIITEINSLDQTHIDNIINVSKFSNFSFKDKLSTLVMINILIGVYNSNFIKDTDKINIKDIKFELNKGEENLIKDIKNVYEKSDDISYDLLRFYNDINLVKNKYELIIDIDNLAQFNHNDSNYEANYAKMVSNVVKKLNNKREDTNKKLEVFTSYIDANDFVVESIVQSSDDINKKFQYYNEIKMMFGNFKKKKRDKTKNETKYGISIINNEVTNQDINRCVREYKDSKNAASYSELLKPLYSILDNEYKIETYIFKRKMLEGKDKYMKDYMKNYMIENYKKIERIDFDNITPFSLDNFHRLIYTRDSFLRYYNENIGKINDVVNNNSFDDILKHNNKLIEQKNNYNKETSILLDNIKEKYRDYINIYISACNSSTENYKQNAMDVLYELLHKINIATFDELVTIKDIFKEVENNFKQKCISNIGFDTNKNTDELIKLIADYKVNKLAEMRLNTQNSPEVGQEVQREANKSSSNASNVSKASKASNGVVDRLLSESEKQSAYDDKNVISERGEQFRLVNQVKRKPFNPFPDLPNVPTPVEKFSEFTDNLTLEQRKAADARAEARAAARTGGKLAANYKSYKSTGKFVYILYKKKRIKRYVYVKAKGRGKYCKIDKEYILLSKLKVV